MENIKIITVFDIEELLCLQCHYRKLKNLCKLENLAGGSG